MRIAIATDNDKGMDAPVSAHFGRCSHYILAEVEEDEVKEVQAIENPYFESHSGPGKVPAFINDQNVDVMISGGMGGRAFSFFEQFGIKAVSGASGTVRQVLEQFLKGNLEGDEPCIHPEREH